MFTAPDADTAAWMRLIEHKGEDEVVTQEMIDGLDHNGRAVLAAVLARGRGGKQLVGDKVNELQQRERALQAREVELANQRAGLLRWAGDPRMKEFLDGLATGDQPDPESAAGQQWSADARFKELMGEFLGRINQYEQDQLALVEQARADATFQEQLAEVRKYTDLHRDDFYMTNEEGVEVLNPTVFARVKELREMGMTLERAHRMTMMELDFEEDEGDRRFEASRERARERSRRPPGRAAVPDTPVNLSGRELDDWYSRHPDAKKRDMDRLRRTGVGYGSGQYARGDEAS